jgi:hypothetical protein
MTRTADHDRILCALVAGTAGISMRRHYLPETTEQTSDPAPPAIQRSTTTSPKPPNKQATRHSRQYNPAPPPARNHRTNKRPGTTANTAQHHHQPETTEQAGHSRWPVGRTGVRVRLGESAECGRPRRRDQRSRRRCGRRSPRRTSRHNRARPRSWPRAAEPCRDGCGCRWRR